MKKLIYLTIALGVLLPLESLAQEPYIFPNNGQSTEQLEQDKFTCYTWAKNESGVDPMQVGSNAAPPPQQAGTSAGVVRGAARGAIVGTAVGAIAGDTGKGAAIGAASGALTGGMRKRSQQRQQQQAAESQAQQQAAQQNQQNSSYSRAYAACLESKGYTVK